MRLSTLFGHTLRRTDAPLLERAGYLWHTQRGPALSPSGLRLWERVLVHLQAAWEANQTILPPREAFSLLDNELPPGGPAPTLPQPWQDLLSEHIRSYRDLPKLLTWSHHLDLQALWLSSHQPPPWEALTTAFAQLGLKPLRLEGWRDAQVWGIPVSEGNHLALQCACGYAALQPWAARGKPRPPSEPPRPLKIVPTPGANTIRALAEQLAVPESRTAKAVLLTEGEQLIFVVVRGDMEVSLPKVAALLGRGPLEPAPEALIRAAGAEPGYASPIGLQDAIVVVDDLIPHSPNLIAGANRPNAHYTGVNYGRDFTAEHIADLVLARPGDPCPHCGAPLTGQSVRILAQATALQPDPTVTFPGPQGSALPLHWAVASVDGLALLQTLAERHRTDQGLAWPLHLAPWPVHLLSLRGGEEVAADLYSTLQQAGWDTLWDDRDASPGVKFTDADLLGLPIRIVVGRRSLEQGGVEVRRLDQATPPRILPPTAVLSWLEDTQ